LSKVSDTARIIKLAAEELPAMRKKLQSLMESNKNRAKGVYEDISKLKDKLIDTLTSAYFSLEEMEETTLAAYTGKLINSVKSFQIMTPDYTKLCAVLNDYITKLPSQSSTVNARVIGRLMNRVKMGYYPTDLEHIGHLERAVSFPEGITTNVFDPCCGCGLALRMLAEGNNCYAYGVELDESRATEALSRLHRVGFGSFFYSRISNEAFHLMLLNPPYLSVLSERGSNFRSEKRFLTDSICHLMLGGLIIYIIPYYRLTEDVCKVLSDNFTDLSVWKFYGDEFKKFKQIAVMGIRKKRQSDPDRMQELSDIAFRIGEIPELGLIPDERYALPSVSKKVEIFKGAEFNVAELAEQLKNSKSFSKLFQKNRLDDMTKRPLLPLNIGQVGLIGGSGLINGLVNCETPHIIKGKIVKETFVTGGGDSISQDARQVSETTTNRMIFNLLTPDGFKSLS
jgi:hypothetical protein